VVVDITVALTRQVEVGVVGQIDDGRQGLGRIKDRPIFHPNFVPWSEQIGHFDMEGPRIVFLAVGAGVGQLQTDVGTVVDLLGNPHPLVEAKIAAMQMVGRVVGCQLVGLPIEAELPIGDPVGIATGDVAEYGFWLTY
jgi:hypothetical protein